MPLPDRIQQHLTTKGIDIPNIKTGVYIPKDVPGITMSHNHTDMVDMIKKSMVSAKEDTVFMKKK